MIGIVCGGGGYPRLVAQACSGKKLDFCLLFMNGFCDCKEWPNVNQLSVNLGEIGKALSFFRKNKVDKIIFAGHIKRPDFSNLSLDKEGIKWLLKLRKAVFAGDDALLRAIAALLQEEGFEIIAGTDLLDDIFLSEGIFSIRAPSVSELKDVQIGIGSAMELGISDIGQSVVVYNGKILGKEDTEGTNSLIERCCRLRSDRKGGILVKISKPKQDNRFDLPTIGVDTIENLYKSGFVGVAVEAEKCIIIDKKAVIRRVNELGLFIIGFSNFLAKKIFIIAGEASGDYLGAKLMEDISAISDQKIDFFGVGGHNMEKAGLRELFSIKELSIIGIFEVIGKIFHVKRLIDKTTDAICKYQPNIVVTIDSSGFTHRVSKRLKKIGCQIPIVHYVAPPVWAWRKWRAKSMYKFIDKLLVLFPFEEEIFSKYNLKTIFVGHPITTDQDFEKPKRSSLQNFLKSVCNIANRANVRIVTLLPGSRISEINKHLPILKEFSTMMVDKYKNVKFIIPTIDNLESHIKKQTENWRVQPIIILQKSQKTLAYYSSDFAVAASGTVTLELAKAGLPSIVIYKTSIITYAIVKFLIKIPYVSLVNILARKRVVPELLQTDCSAKNIFQYAKKILSANESERQKKSFKEIIKLLTTTNNNQAAMEIRELL